MDIWVVKWIDGYMDEWIVRWLKELRKGYMNR